MIARGSIATLVTNYVIEYTPFTTFIDQSYYRTRGGGGGGGHKKEPYFWYFPQEFLKSFP